MADGSNTHGMQAAQHGRIVRSGFRPHPLLRNPHLQTLLPEFLLPLPELELRTERLELHDGDFIDLGWSGPQAGTAPIAILIHGFAGGFQSKYVRALARQLNAQGCTTVILQLRGAGPEPNRLPRGYHHGDTEDLRALWHLLRERHPQAPLLATGWSLGGCVLLKALGEDGARAPLAAAVAVSAPLDLRRCAAHLNATGMARLYQLAMLGYIKDSIRRKHGPVPLPQGIDLQAALAAKDFIAFCGAYTAPLNGYRDAEDMCERAACGPYLRHIQVPSLMLQARDDPMLGEAALVDEQQLSAQVTLEVSDYGGHVGFVAEDQRGWLEQRISAYLRERLPAASVLH